MESAEGFRHTEARRREHWRQTAESRIKDPAEAAQLIEQVGIATLFPASPEVPNLFHAYTGDPTAATDSGHDSPSGQVYAWRWVLGRQEAAFYCTLVRDRPTWVRWTLFPAVLRLLGEVRTPDDLYSAGEISIGAYRVAQALAEAGGLLSTGDLRREAGFPLGKAQRAAYLKAVDELDRRLLLAKVFSPDDDDMRHALVQVRYPAHAGSSTRMTRDEALEALLTAYLPMAVFAVPAVLAKHLKIPEVELCAGLDRLVEIGRATTQAIPNQQRPLYLWMDPS